MVGAGSDRGTHSDQTNFRRQGRKFNLSGLAILFLLCSIRGMTDRPASWRMPTPEQMEKLAAEAGLEIREPC